MANKDDKNRRRGGTPPRKRSTRKEETVKRDELVVWNCPMGSCPERGTATSQAAADKALDAHLRAGHPNRMG